ncbi:MAG: hypothetical protein ABR548_00325 [Actinomycetota bacterium]|nr:hypothetical protein [Actinomycetota bacterium]
MGRKPKRAQKDDARRLDSGETVNWDAAMKSLLASLPGMVPDPTTADTPRLIIRLP